MDNNSIATVVKHTGSQYLLTQLPKWELFPAVIRGKMRLKETNSTNPIAVGDNVVFERIDGEVATIKEILPRKNYIIRRSTNLSRQSHIIAANLDMVFLIVTIDFPEIKMQFIDRFLVTCEAYHIPVTLIINKTDLYSQEQIGNLNNMKDIYTNIGYNVILTSAKKNEGINQIKDICKGKIVLFSGQSGVGKSTLINSLDSNLSLKTGEISDYHLQGKHTTTFYQMHPLVSGGWVIDTPGIRGFGLVDLSKEELSTYFPEMLKLMDNCKFAPCTHTHEPGCAIKQAVEDGVISFERYESYLGMLNEDTKYR